MSSEYLGSTCYTELYSFKSGYWKRIGSPKASIMSPCAVYVRGKLNLKPITANSGFDNIFVH